MTKVKRRKIREGVDRETGRAVARGGQHLQTRLEHRESRWKYAPKGVNPDIVRLIKRQEMKNPNG